MSQQMTITIRHLHEIEDELIQLAGLVKALQLIETDEGAIICMTNAIEERLKKLEHAFYTHWEWLYADSYSKIKASTCSLVSS